MAKIKVKKIIDGDTFQDTNSNFFRLANINTPEKKEPGYKKAKGILDQFIGDKEIIIKVEGISYGRKVVTVKMPGEKMTVNTKMRRKGFK
ncbi:MAG: thermonuclease family protein [Promethearchaeota archaeon]